MNKQLKRKKQYKADTPERTITRIRSILCEKLGIVLEEEDFKSEGGFYSTRIKIGNHFLSEKDYGTNGKGMTFPYALASAHGEFMERLENQAIIRAKELAYKDSVLVRSNIDYMSFLKKHGVLLDYQYAPDEMYVYTTLDNIDNLFKNLGSCNKGRISAKYINKKLTLLPFYNITKRKVCLLPYDIVFFNCTSNGMCAGNTPKEAIIQGISEIIERFILREIYMNGLSLPTIPDEYFFGTDIFSKIGKLKEKYGKNWNFLIKDCSLGKNYPAVGILMINIEERKYLFHLGVDPSPITALERSLTEIFQGREIASIMVMDYGIQSGMMSNPDIQDAEFYKTCTTGTGHFPISILKEPEYSNFEGFDSSWGLSDDKDLKKLISLIENDGYEILIRDVSFLGFPAYCIYIPDITEFRNVIKNNPEEHDILLKSQATTAAYDLWNASVEHIGALIECVKNQPKYISEIMKFDAQSFLIKYDKNLVVGILYIIIGNFKEAYESISLYCSRFVGTSKEVLFFSALKDMLLCKCRNMNYEGLALLYDKTTLMSIEAFIQNREVLNYVPYTSFKKCDWDAFMKSHPDFIGMLHVMKNLEKAYIENTPNQENLQEILK